MRIFDLAVKDIRQIVRDRKAFLFLLAMPITFTVLFGIGFGGFHAGENADLRLPVGWLDEDNSAASIAMHAMLSQSQVVRLVDAGIMRNELMAQVDEGTVAAAVIVPYGFGGQLRDGDVIPLDLLADGSSQAGFSAETEIQAAAQRLFAAARAAQISAAIAEAHGVSADYDGALARAMAAWSSPPVTVYVTETGFSAEDQTLLGSANAFANTSPGMMAQFAIAGLLSAAQILTLERKSGSLKRLLTTNMSRNAILLGHFVAMFLIIFAQMSLLVLFGQLFLRLNYFSAPVATLLLITMSALFSASLGLLIGVQAKSEEQVVMYALVAMFVLAALGGAWLPLEFTPETFQRIAFMTPIAWMIDGFQEISVRGLGLTAIADSLLVLLLFSVALVGLALWRFRSEER
ncbi:MAG: ABC transporter permease [Anaerolineae bacterium]|nr:ABC transporter permease [Anaerolineae bacterium]MCO5191749.1 ABC transporter permease [Anaerolineae bacterium]